MDEVQKTILCRLKRCTVGMNSRGNHSVTNCCKYKRGMRVPTVVFRVTEYLGKVTFRTLGIV